jgi:hypothetical protein
MVSQGEQGNESLRCADTAASCCGSAHCPLPMHAGRALPTVHCQCTPAGSKPVPKQLFFFFLNLGDPHSYSFERKYVGRVIHSFPVRDRGSNPGQWAVPRAATPPELSPYYIEATLTSHHFFTQIPLELLSLIFFPYLPISSLT